MGFDGIEYTRREATKQLLKIEEHVTNGSALDAGCACIQERHLLSFEGYGDEGQAIATATEEKKFWSVASLWARESWKKIIADPWNEKVYDCIRDEARMIRLAIEHQIFNFPIEPSGCSLCIQCKTKNSAHTAKCIGPECNKKVQA